MATIIPPGFAEVTTYFRHSMASKDWAVVTGHDISGYGGDLEDAGLQIGGGWNDPASFVPSMDNNVTITRVRIQAGSDPGPGPIVEVPLGFVGGVSAEFPPPNVALLIRKNTGFGGRYNAGRLFLPSMVPEGGVNEIGQLDAGQLAARQADATGLLNAWSTGVGGSPIPAPLHILHDAASPVVTPTLVTSLSVQQLMATQRRRMRS